MNLEFISLNLIHELPVSHFVPHLIRLVEALEKFY